MNRLFKSFIFWTIPILLLLAVSCKDDEDPIEQPEPAITSVSPSEGPVGTVMTITGVNLDNVNSVQFGNVNAEGFNPADNTPTTISATVPAGLSPGVQTILITSPGGTATANFTVTEEATGGPEPVITEVSPNMGRVGDAVTILGSDLTGVTAVTFGEIEAEAFTVDEDGASITTTIPEGLEEGATTITVTSPGGEATADFTILGVAPVIATFDPTTGAVGEQITVTGTDLNLATSARIGEVEIADWEAAEDGTTATFTVPEGAETGRIIIVTEPGDEIESETDFTVSEGEPASLETFTVEVNAQGVRNDPGMLTAFSADGLVATLAAVTTGEVGSSMIDFIPADSGGDNGLDLFSPSHESWLAENYFEDAEGNPVVWPVLNQTKMVHLEDQDADFFENATADDIAGLTIGEEFETRIEISPNDDGSPNVPQVILFETADGKKGLLLYRGHIPNAGAGSKADIFTFDIKVLETGE